MLSSKRKNDDEKQKKQKQKWKILKFETKIRMSVLCALIFSY